MLHLITAVRNQQYKPLERYRDNDTLLADIAATYKKAVAAFYEAGCRYLQFDDTSCGGNSARRKKEPGISPAVSTWIASNGIMCP